MPGTYDIAVDRGGTLARIFRFKANNVLVDLTGKSLVFRAAYLGSTIRKQTGVDAGFTMATPSSGEAELVLSPAETRRVPVGSKMKYELEAWEDNEAEAPWMTGYLVGSGGVNDDA